MSAKFSSADSLPSSQEHHVPGGTAYPSITERLPVILAVEDNEDNLLLIVHALEVFPCQVLTAIDGTSALTIAQTHQPDLILADIMLPTLDGFELIDQLQKIPETQAIPIIAITAMARLEDRDRILAAGFVDYLSKPYMLDDLQAIVRRYLS